MKIVPKVEDLKGELSEIVHCQCAFCEKMVALPAPQRRLCERLSGGEQFFCSFCLRHGFNGRNNKHVLPLSFRAIAGYYYYDRYLNTPNRQMWLAEIKEYMDIHAQAGLQNPVFSYDPDSYLWFIDFNRIGRGKRKVRVVEVYRTIINILACFNLSEHIPSIREAKLYEKYSNAIHKFYSQRYRPEGKRILIPTLGGCGVTENKKFSLDITRDFVPSDLEIG